MLERNILVTIVLIVLAAIVFALWPGLDLLVASQFVAERRFSGREGVVAMGRKFFQITPFLLLAAFVAAWFCARRRRTLAARVFCQHDLLFIACVFVMGPALIVNLGLKDNWGRPRPPHTVELGGAHDFRPWWQFGGPCRKNCSFVSGEVSMVAAFTAPVLIAAPPVQAALFVVTGAAVVTTSYCRIAAGGHFLSDTVFAALFTWLIVLLLYGAFYRWPLRSAWLSRRLELASFARARLQI